MRTQSSSYLFFRNSNSHRFSEFALQFFIGFGKRDFFRTNFFAENNWIMARSSSSSRSRSPRRDGRHHSDRPRAPRDRDSRSPQASSVRTRRDRRSSTDFSTAVGLLRDATSLLSKKKDQPSDRPVSLG